MTTISFLLQESPQAARVKVLASGNATERRFRCVIYLMSMHLLWFWCLMMPFPLLLFYFSFLVISCNWQIWFIISSPFLSYFLSFILTYFFHSFFPFYFLSCFSFHNLRDLNSFNILYKGSLGVEPSPLTLDEEWRLVLVP